MISLYYYPCYWNDFAVTNGSDSLYFPTTIGILSLNWSVKAV